MFRDAIAMRLTAFDVIKFAWLIFAVYWFFSALRVKKMRRREPVSQRLVYLFVTAFAIFLLSDLAPGALLHRHFVPARQWVRIVGSA